MSRKRVSQPVNRYKGLDVMKISWTDGEKRALLKALKQYGHNDTQSLAKALPNKSPAAIKNMINNLTMAAKRSTKPGPLPPIDMWLEQAAKNEINALIPQALMFISMFERQPTPQECGGCDLRAAHDYIYRMTQGHQAVELPRETRKMVYKLIAKTVSKLRVKSAENLLQVVNNLYAPTPQKNYTREKRSPQKIGPSTLLQELNTFSVPSDRLQIT